MTGKLKTEKRIESVSLTVWTEKGQNPQAILFQSIVLESDENRDILLLVACMYALFWKFGLLCSGQH